MTSRAPCGHAPDGAGSARRRRGKRRQEAIYREFTGVGHEASLPGCWRRPAGPQCAPRSLPHRSTAACRGRNGTSNPALRQSAGNPMTWGNSAPSAVLAAPAALALGHPRSALSLCAPTHRPILHGRYHDHTRRRMQRWRMHLLGTRQRPSTRNGRRIAIPPFCALANRAGERAIDSIRQRRRRRDGATRADCDNPLEVILPFEPFAAMHGASAAKKRMRAQRICPWFCAAVGAGPCAGLVAARPAFPDLRCRCGRLRLLAHVRSASHIVVGRVVASEVFRWLFLGDSNEICTA